MPAPAATTLIDAVDAADRHVGEVARGAALGLGANFRTAHVFVFNSAGDLLLQRLAPKRGRHPRQWGSSVAAYLFAGETYLHAARRRAREELDLHVAMQQVGKIQMRDERSLKFVTLFTAEAAAARIREPEHIAELRFWSSLQLAGEIEAQPSAFTPTFLELYEFYRQRDRNR
jgi:isopentenyl-diphosphate Delta-isomerase